ncbi:protein-L-isoaspartate(D-aspartate) O-methyltransferase [Rhodoferax sp. TS-BS-61-7]|jgi:protein-L-isoaspartate(D-aspartate) O-methyltransferase|uniref:protein-L-isoaspartate(D-aspartate) O-methyltransferase n=1 Tax=Rhodoferax sp. TS-BS-61-7 TaxID=2094194 RepID=UPI00268B0EFA
MKPRPSFPARLDATLAKTRPNPHGAVASSGVSVAKPIPKTAAQAAPAKPVVLPTARAKASSHPLHHMPQGHGMDSEAVRQRMVQKLAGQGVTDPLVLGAMGAIERHRFVDSALVNQAYEDTSLPIGLGQTISKPGVVSRMIELLRNGATGRVGRVLEIGTGCGYQAAVLSLVADEVYSIERLRGLHDKARENLRHLRLPNVHLLFGDGMAGYAKGAPYAGIIAAAGGEALPQAWVDQLAVGGRLVAPVVTGAGTQALLVLDKTPQGVRQTLLEAVHFVPLKSGIA